MRTALEVRWEQGAAVFAVTGRADDELWAAVERALAVSAEDGAIVVFDLSELDLDDHGVDALSCLVARAGHIDIRLACEGLPHRRRLREMTGGRLQARPSIDQALADLPRRAAIHPHAAEARPEDPPRGSPAGPGRRPRQSSEASSS
ncbi:MAG TPA: hypothetical protein VGM93_13390 [Acidimicrobiales bacterium]|jgi:hypothetical protein